MCTCAKAEDKSRLSESQLSDWISNEPIPMRKSMIGDSSCSQSPIRQSLDTQVALSVGVDTVDEQGHGQGILASPGKVVIGGDGDDNVSVRKRRTAERKARRHADDRENRKARHSGKDKKSQATSKNEEISAGATMSKSKPLMGRLYSLKSFMSNDGYDYMESDAVELPANCSDRKGYDRSLSALEKGGNRAGTDSDSSSFNGDDSFSDGESSLDSQTDEPSQKPAYRGMYSIASEDSSDDNDIRPTEQSRPMETIRRVMPGGLSKKKDAQSRARRDSRRDSKSNAYASTSRHEPSRLDAMFQLEAAVNHDHSGPVCRERHGRLAKDTHSKRLLRTLSSDVSEYDVKVRRPSRGGKSGDSPAAL